MQRRVAWLTVFVTYTLMVWGNTVSATGSGLACPDWPLCHGTLLPPLSFAVVLEWGHRLLAATATTFILTTLWLCFRGASPLRAYGWGLAALLAAQIGLGGLTVKLGLSLPVSTIHLLLANLLFAALIALALQSQAPRQATPPARALRALSLAATAGILIQLALGGLVRHAHAGLACPNFPSCLGSFWPDPFVLQTAAAFTHRWWGIALLAVYAALARQAWKHRQGLPGFVRLLSLAALLVALSQAALGILTVLQGLSVPLRAGHAALGYALWGLTAALAISSLPLPVRKEPAPCYEPSVS